MSTTIMANAMLEEDFKTSHPDLSKYANEAEAHDSLKNKNDTDGEAKAILKDGSSSTSSSPKRKSVDFAIKPPPPTKRTRIHSRLTPKQVVDALGTSITRSERLDAIAKAKDAFDHDVPNLHTEEIGAGADAALAKHLGFLVYMHMGQHEAESIEDELSSTCHAMDLLYQASSDSVGASFERMGSVLLSLLVTLVNDQLEQRVQSVATQQQQQQQQVQQSQEQPQRQEQQQEQPPEQQYTASGTEKKEQDSREQATTTNDSDRERSPTMLGRRSITPPPLLVHNEQGDFLLRKITRILGHFARVGNATKPMAHFPGLLGCLVSLVTFQPYDCIPWEARLSALWTIANLGCNPDNMQLLVCTPGLVNALVQVACRPLRPGDSLESTMELLRSRSIASRGLLNVSWAPENKIALAEHAALIDLLAELAVHRETLHKYHASKTISDILQTTRRHAVGALRNLAAAPRRTKIALCEYRNGHLLDVLTDAALNDSDTNVKDRAFAAIHNLAVHGTAEKIVNHPALVLALKDVLLSQEEEEREHAASAEHQDGSQRSHASATLMVLERSITPDMDSYENLKSLLEAINPNPATPEESESDEMEAIHTTAV